jgi:GNAT superfamily N-acetyltransferase
MNENSLNGGYGSIPVIGGRYRHYKGKEYTVLAVGRHSEDLSPLVVYRAEYGDHAVWVRPLSMFMDCVSAEGVVQRRFSCISDVLFRKAYSPETDAVTQLYRSCVGLPGCVWDEAYPTRDMAEQDIAEGSLYVLYEKETLIGVVSRIDHDDLDELPLWTQTEHPSILVRIGITPSRQHQGWGTKLLHCFIEEVWRGGADSIRLLCAQQNEYANRMYRRAGFMVRGEAEMYGHRYFCLELVRHTGGKTDGSAPNSRNILA